MAANTLITNILTFERTAAALQAYGEAVAAAYKDELLGDDRIASGELIRSVKAVVTRAGGAQFEVALDMAAYWKYVEYGTRPHWPPPDKIREWIVAKPVIPRPLANGKLPTLEQLSFLISRKIARYGTKGTNTLRHTLEELNSEWADRIALALADDVTDAAGVLFMDF